MYFILLHLLVHVRNICCSRDRALRRKRLHFEPLRTRWSHWLFANLWRHPKFSSECSVHGKKTYQHGAPKSQALPTVWRLAHWEIRIGGSNVVGALPCYQKGWRHDLCDRSGFVEPGYIVQHPLISNLLLRKQAAILECQWSYMLNIGSKGTSQRFFICQENILTCLFGRNNLDITHKVGERRIEDWWTLTVQVSVLMKSCNLNDCSYRDRVRCRAERFSLPSNSRSHDLNAII